jgi:hypothetical protein
LESQGVRCWIAPRDVIPGRSYPEAIEEAIAGSRLIVVVFSQCAADSHDVRSEIHLAFQQEITIVCASLYRTSTLQRHSEGHQYGAL